MDLKLEPLRLAGLSNLEAGQLVRRHLSDFATIDPALLTDAPYNVYIQSLTALSDTYQKALAQVQKNEETEKISLADGVRDVALKAFNAGLKQYALSDDPAEVEASRVLGILFNNFNNLATLNYEAETNGIDKLLSELEKGSYSVHINLLQMGRYVIRIKSANENFKTLFGNRLVSDAMTETFDMKSVRAELFTKYGEFTTYVLAMAKALNTPLFLNALNLLNIARKYYADLLARRNGNNTNSTATPTAP